MVHISEELSRILRLFIRHIRFFRPWDRENKAKIEVLEGLFRVINRYLQDLGVEYWLAYGTLLGYYREGQIMTHDLDIDIGAHEKEFAKIWEGRKRLPRGFKMCDTSHKHPGPKIYLTYKGWEADIYFYEDTVSHLRCYLDSNLPGDLKPFPKNYIYPIKDTVFLGQKTFIPNKVEALLLHNYGYIGENGKWDKKTGYWHPKNSERVK